MWFVDKYCLSLLLQKYNYYLKYRSLYQKK